MALAGLGCGYPDHAVFQRILSFSPSRQAPFQGADTLESKLFHLQRHTGAGGFAGSSTYQYEFTLQR